MYLETHLQEEENVDVYMEVKRWSINIKITVRNSQVRLSDAFLYST